MAEIIERIPHKDVSYAFLEIRASNGNEFAALREDALKNSPHYAFASASPAEPKVVEAAEAGEVEKQPEQPVAPPAAAGPETAASAPTSTEGLSPREIARQRLAQKGAA